MYNSVVIIVVAFVFLLAISIISSYHMRDNTDNSANYKHLHVFIVKTVAYKKERNEEKLASKTIQAKEHMP